MGLLAARSIRCCLRLVVMLLGGVAMSDVNIARLSRRDRQLWLDGYVWGFQHGVDRGLEISEDEWRGRMAVSAAIARQIAEAGPYDALADRRGEHDRAQAQRDLLAERGIS